MISGAGVWFAFFGSEVEEGTQAARKSFDICS